MLGRSLSRKWCTLPESKICKQLLTIRKLLFLHRFRKEINVVAVTSYIKGVSTALMVFTERVTLFLTIVAFVLIGNDLTGEIIFSVAQLFNTLQLYMAIFYPMAMTSLAEAKISVKRIEVKRLQHHVNRLITAINFILIIP